MLLALALTYIIHWYSTFESAKNKRRINKHYSFPIICCIFKCMWRKEEGYGVSNVLFYCHFFFSFFKRLAEISFVESLVYFCIIYYLSFFFTLKLSFCSFVYSKSPKSPTKYKLYLFINLYTHIHMPKYDRSTSKEYKNREIWNKKRQKKEIRKNMLVM